MLRTIRIPVACPVESAAKVRPIADAASARLWLAEGIPIADIITMLVFRHRFKLTPDACRTYAVEIIFRAWQENPAMQQPSQAHREESHHAIA
jgi:hypothetical protein